MLAAAFTPNPNRYGVMRGYDERNQRKISSTVMQPITERLVRSHLRLAPGEQVGRIGYLCGREDGTDVVALDVDRRGQHQGSFDETVQQLLDAAEALELSCYWEQSTHGGMHLWFFLDAMIPWEQAYWLAKAVTMRAGHPYIETFPSSATSGPDGKWIFLPYAGALHPDTKLPGLGDSTHLVSPEGRNVEVWELPYITRIRAKHAKRVALKAKANMRAQITEAEEAGELVQDLDTGSFAQLRQAMLDPPTEFPRHDAIASFLNLGLRSGQLEQMHELLRSREVFDAWVRDGSRDHGSWVDEVNRWADRIRRDTGELRSRYGIKALLDAGWQIGSLQRRPEVDIASAPDLNKIPDGELARIMWELLKMDGMHWWYDPDMAVAYRWDGRTYSPEQHWVDDIKRWIDHKAASLGKHVREGKLTAVYTKLERNHLTRRISRDQDPELLACENGVINWRSGELLPPSPELITIGRVRASWDPNADVEQEWQGSEWVEFLTSVLAIEDGQLLQASLETMAEFFGFCLMPLTETAPVRGVRKILNFHGPSSTGKTTVWRAVLAVLGDQAGHDSSGIAMSSDQDLFASQDWAQKLVGKRLVVFDEMNTGGHEGRKIINALKVLAGNGAVTINPKGKKSSQARLGCRLLMCTNYGLRLFEDSSNDAFFRRLLRVKFERVVSREEERSDYEDGLVRNPDVRAQALMWMVDGLRRLSGNDWSFQHDGLLALSLREDREEANPIIMFLQQRAGPAESYSKDTRLTTTDILQHYNAWAGENGQRLLAATSLGRQLPDALGQVSWGKGVRSGFMNGYKVWEGLRIVDVFGEPIESPIVREMLVRSMTN